MSQNGGSEPLFETDVGLTYVLHEAVYGKRFKDMRRRVPDLSKLEAAIGFELRFSPDEILRAVIEDVMACRSDVPVSPERFNGPMKTAKRKGSHY